MGSTKQSSVDFWQDALGRRFAFEEPNTCTSILAMVERLLVEARTRTSRDAAGPLRMKGF